MTAPLFSFVMCAYNAERTISAALDSMLIQTADDCEVVVVNDGSTDATPKILADYAGREPRLRVIEQENQGLTKALNVAIRGAKGAYIVRQDADDVSLPNRLAEVRRVVALSQPDIVLSQAFEVIEGARTRVIPRKRLLGSVNRIRRMLRFGNFFVHGTLIAKRDVLLSEPYDERWRYAQDYELLLRLLLAKRYVVHIVETPLYEFVRSATSISSAKRIQQDEFASAALKRHLGTDFWLICRSGPVVQMVKKTVREIYASFAGR